MAKKKKNRSNKGNTFIEVHCNDSLWYKLHNDDLMMTDEFILPNRTTTSKHIDEISWRIGTGNR